MHHLKMIKSIALFLEKFTPLFQVFFFNFAILACILGFPKFICVIGATFIIEKLKLIKFISNFFFFFKDYSNSISDYWRTNLIYTRKSIYILLFLGIFFLFLGYYLPFYTRILLESASILFFFALFTVIFSNLYAIFTLKSNNKIIKSIFLILQFLYLLFGGLILMFFIFHKKLFNGVFDFFFIGLLKLLT